MKIGIMTPSNEVSGNNYGTVLQSFALQWYLRNLGHDAYVINYNPSSGKKNPIWLRAFHALNPTIFFRYFDAKKQKALLKKENEVYPRCFDDFSHKYINKSPVVYSRLSDLRENPPEADVYICGSDNIWGGEISSFKNHEKQIWFLDFGRDDIPRIAYAPSGFNIEYPKAYIDRVRPLLKRFQAVSVREKSGVELCRRAGYEDAKWVCDPTLLLTADEYRKIYNENTIRKRNKKYLLLYILHNDKNADFNALCKFAESKGLEVVLVYNRVVNIKNVDVIRPTIPEWLYLIDNAEYFITNSFHGTVFATMFGKQYGVVHYKGKNETGNVRHNSLFEMCNIEPRWINSKEDFSILDKPYTADIASFRADSMNFLDEALRKSIGGGAKRLIGFALRSKKPHKPTYLTRNRLLFIQSRSPSFLNRREA